MRHYSWEHKAKWVGNETGQLGQDQVVLECSYLACSDENLVLFSSVNIEFVQGSNLSLRGK